MATLIASGWAILFGIYLIYDTQLILGGKYDQLDLEDYILGALLLYSDIIGLFIQLLQLFGNSNQN